MHEDEWANGPSAEMRQEWRADLTARLQRVCAHLSAEDFGDLLDRMVRSR